MVLSAAERLKKSRRPTNNAGLRYRIFSSLTTRHSPLTSFPRNEPAKLGSTVDGAVRRPLRLEWRRLGWSERCGHCRFLLQRLQLPPVILCQPGLLFGRKGANQHELEGILSA
jgi:hypothetical protein